MSKYLIVKEGALKDLILDLDKKDKYIIGRDSDVVDYVVEDKTVSRKHAVCFKENGKIYIQDLSHTNPILVNNQNITEPYLLKDKDTIKIGNTVFTYSEEEKPIYSEEPKSEYPKDKEKTVYKDLRSRESESQDLESQDLESRDLEKKEDIYDTIFEEEPEEELPFTMISEYPFLLKVISGPNSGAEFGMEKNTEYILGKDPNICDIAFNDLSVSKEHAKIKIEETDIFIEDLKSKNGVIVNNEKIDKTQKITTQDIISLGTTSFLIIDQKASLETIYSEPPKIEKPKEPTWKDEAIPSKYLFIGGGALLTIFIMVISFFSLFKSKEIEVSKKEPIEEITKAVENFQDVKFSYNPAGNKLFLTGHVLTSNDEQELFYNIEKIGFIKNIENNIIIDEYVWKNTNDVINDNPSWKGVFLHSVKPGIFVLSGYLQNIKDLESLKDYLNVNFPYVDKLIYEVTTADVLNTEISGILLSSDLGSLSFQFVNGEVILAGRYSDEKNFKEAEDKIKKLKGVRSIKNVAIKTTKQTAMIDLTEKYLVSGYASKNNKNISVIINDKIFSVGDVLDGMMIKNIKINTIYLEKGGFKYKIDYKKDI